LLWGPPAGIVVQGALLGGLSALLALGLALVYRANRILNFAQGDLGAAPASLAVLLVVTSGASWLVAFATGLVAALALGAAVEVLVIRRFFRSPRLILTVATIGLAQVLAGLGLLLPALAAAVIGRMERLPTIAFAAIALGIVEQSVLWGWNQPSDVQPVLFVVVLVAVWLTPPGAGLRGRLEPSTWRAIREPRPVP